MTSLQRATSSRVRMPLPSLATVGRRPSSRRQACHCGNDNSPGVGTRPALIASNSVTPSASPDTWVLIPRPCREPRAQPAAPKTRRVQRGETHPRTANDPNRTVSQNSPQLRTRPHQLAQLLLLAKSLAVSGATFATPSQPSRATLVAQLEPK